MVDHASTLRKLCFSVDNTQVSDSANTNGVRKGFPREWGDGVVIEISQILQFPCFRFRISVDHAFALYITYSYIQP